MGLARWCEPQPLGEDMQKQLSPVVVAIVIVVIVALVGFFGYKQVAVGSKKGVSAPPPAYTGGIPSGGSLSTGGAAPR